MKFNFLSLTEIIIIWVTSRVTLNNTETHDKVTTNSALRYLGIPNNVLQNDIKCPDPRVLNRLHHTSPSNANVRNAWSYTSTLPHSIFILRWKSQNKNLCRLHPIIRKLGCQLTFQSLAVSLRSTRFNIQKFYMALALRWLFLTGVGTNSDYFPIHH